jgi:hypothetical protein
MELMKKVMTIKWWDRNKLKNNLREVYKIFGEGEPKWNLLKALPKDKKFIFEKYK